MVASDTKVIVGMSGGVDSSVAAYRLLQQGYQVEGLFMKNWEQDDTEEYCPAKADMLDAKAVCDKLGIPLHVANFSQDYWDRVFRIFLTEYQAGRTPNPDILCNKEIKFKAFLDYAVKLGADCIATGHYVRRSEHFPDALAAWKKIGNDKVWLQKGLDDNKDQSYFLHALNQQQITHALFPIGALNKATVRQMALDQGLITHDKKDSTGICFIGERPFQAFLQAYIPAQPGHMVTADGQVVGQHQGLMYHTIGQRKGLHIGGVKGYPEAPWFVADKRLDTNELLVVQGDDPALYHQYLSASQLNWVAGVRPELKQRIHAKIRYRQADELCEVLAWMGDGDRCHVRFVRPQKAVAPGQSIVFYVGDVCLGGGVIDQRWNEPS